MGLNYGNDHGRRITLQSSTRTWSHHFNLDLNDHNMDYISEESNIDAT